MYTTREGSPRCGLLTSPLGARRVGGPLALTPLLPVCPEGAATGMIDTLPGGGPMRQYVIRMTHPPDQCPTANARIREVFIKGAPELPRLAQRLGVKFLAGPYILGAEHETVIVVESETLEAVQDVIVQSGLVQWNAVRVSYAMSVQEAVQNMERVPPPLYT